MTPFPETAVPAGLEGRIQRLLEPGAIVPVFQPIVRISDGALIGYEALARMPDMGDLAPDEWLRLADRVELRTDLDLACWAAVAERGAPPEDRLLFVNTSPRTLEDARLHDLRHRLPDRLVLELTEQEAVSDYELLRSRLQAWSNDGVRLAIDDTGAGYSSLQHVLQLSPEFLKLDRSLISHLDTDRSRRALVWSLVAFAREVGSTVIAEGVERLEELHVLRLAGVHLAQGWLFGQPGPPWPTPTWTGLSMPPVPLSLAVSGSLGDELRAATDVAAACAAVCEHLYRRGQVMPSVYMERHGLLRCLAQRGYWQILDGIPAATGLIGRCFRSGETLVINDVHAYPEFLEAAPGLRSEVLVPLWAEGRLVGVLTTESHSEADPADVAEVERCATLLGARLEQLGIQWSDSPLARLARSSKELAGLSDGAEVQAAVVRMACDVSGMGSAFLAVLAADGAVNVAEAAGPLAGAFRALEPDEVARLASMVDEVTSCYTAGDVTGRPVAGTERLRAAGAVEVVVLPLISLGRRTGILVVANTSPMALSTEEIEPLELLAAEAGRCLDLAERVAELRWRATRDPLTGLENHSAFYELLARRDRRGSMTVGIADLDGFKAVNDTHGHLVGDTLLRDVAETMTQALRGDDRVFRIGGDEFGLVLPHTDGESGLEVAARLCDAAAAVLAPFGASLSVGLAVPARDEPEAGYLARADVALYEAKRGSRGCAILGSAPTSAG